MDKVYAIVVIDYDSVVSEYAQWPILTESIAGYYKTIEAAEEAAAKSGYKMPPEGSVTCEDVPYFRIKTIEVQG